MTDDQALLEPEQHDPPYHKVSTTSEAAGEAAESAVLKVKFRRLRRLRLPTPERLLPGFFRRRLGGAARFVALGLMLLVIGGAGFGGWLAAKHFGLVGVQPVSHFAAVTVPFRISDTTPANASTNVLDGTSITIDFSRPVTPTKLAGDFFVSPQVGGTFTAGASSTEAVFTPSQPFKAGAIVKVMIHGEFQSNDGARLGADYSFSYTMAVGQNSVTFQRDNGFQVDADSAPVGTPVSYTMQVGSAVDNNGTVTVYKGGMAEMLKSLIYVQQPSKDGDWVNTDFADATVDTGALQAVQTIKGLADGKTFTVSQGEGVYAVVAQSKSGIQVGHFWLTVSSLGVVIRQDDQQMLVYAHDYGDAAATSITATTYNLRGSVQQLSQTAIDGMGNINTGFSPAVDALVAQTSDGRVAFIPVAGYLSMADVRVQKDLSANDAFYGLTDRPSYAVGQTMHYAAFVRADNDALYQLPTAGSSVKLYIADSQYGKHLSDFTANVSPSGMINGDITIPSSYATKNGVRTLTLFAAGGAPYAVNQIANNDQLVASFTVVEHANTTGNVVVSFTKPSYLASDSVAASVLVTDANGAPRANTAIHADVYAKQYFEGDATQNNRDTIGDKVDALSGTFHTDTAGRAIIPIDFSKLPGDYSQSVTVQVSYKNGSVTAAGGTSMIIHQGNGVLNFGSSPTVVYAGGKLVARVYATDLSGKVLAGTDVNYKLVSRQYVEGTGEEDIKQLASGSVTADSSGYAQISIPLSAHISTTASLELDVSAGDAFNNKITSANYYYFGDPNSSTAYSDVVLANLDISGAPSEVNVGQTLHLTVHSPTAIDALVTLERGRIYKSEVVHLSQGDNSYSVTVTSDLLPSFNLMFSYISSGAYHAEGTSFTVTPTSKQASLALTTNKATYAAGSTATISLAAHDAATDPLATSVVLGVVDAHVYDLYKDTTPDMLTSLYSPRETTINGSSSLTIVGTGGGKCGGGGADQAVLSNPTGQTLLWLPTLTTSDAGTATATVKLPKGTWQIYAYTMSGDTVVGSTTLTVRAK